MISVFSPAPPCWLSVFFLFFFTLFDKERLNGKAWDAPVRRWFHHEREPGGSKCAVWVFKKSYFAVRLTCVQTCVYLTGIWGGDDDMCWGWRVGGGLAWGQRVRAFCWDHFRGATQGSKGDSLGKDASHQQTCLTFVLVLFFSQCVALTVLTCISVLSAAFLLIHAGKVLRHSLLRSPALFVLACLSFYPFPSHPSISSLPLLAWPVPLIWFLIFVLHLISSPFVYVGVKCSPSLRRCLCLLC